MYLKHGNQATGSNELKKKKDKSTAEMTQRREPKPAPSENPYVVLAGRLRWLPCVCCVTGVDVGNLVCPFTLL